MAMLVLDIQACEVSEGVYTVIDSMLCSKMSILSGSKWLKPIKRRQRRRTLVAATRMLHISEITIEVEILEDHAAEL